MSFFHFWNFFTGLGHLVWHFGSAGVAIVLLVVASFTSPVFKKGFLWLALAVFVYLVGLTVGVKDETGRCEARNAAVKAAIERIARDSRDPRVRGLLDKWDDPNI